MEINSIVARTTAAAFDIGAALAAPMLAFLILNLFDVGSGVRGSLMIAAFVGFRIALAAVADARGRSTIGRAALGHMAGDLLGAPLGSGRAVVRRVVGDVWALAPWLLGAAVASWRSGLAPVDFGVRDWAVAGFVWADLVALVVFGVRSRYGRWCWPHDAIVQTSIVEAESPDILVEMGGGLQIRALPEDIGRFAPFDEERRRAWQEELAADPGGPFADIDALVDWTAPEQAPSRPV